MSAQYGDDGHTESYTYSADGYLEDTRMANAGSNYLASRRG